LTLPAYLWLNQWRSQPKNLGGQKGGGAKCMISGEQHYFLWKNVSQSTKWLYFPEIFGGHGPFGSPLATPMGWIPIIYEIFDQISLKINLVRR